MTAPRVVVAGTGFSAVRTFFSRAMPDARLDMVDRDILQRDGFEADVLIPAMSRINGALMDRIRGLRLIQQWGAGLEGVELEEATRRGIAVANVPSTGGNAESVAEWCVMAAIAVGRRLPVAFETIRTGSGWGTPMGQSLLGKTAGIIGLGGIGQALAMRLRPFGMRIIGIKQTPEPSMAERLGMEWVGGPERLPELLRDSDFVFLCVPQTERTRRIIDELAISSMKTGVCIINAGRGGLIDQAALTRALADGRLSGAGLDVFETEPLDPRSELLNRPEVIATPHIAGVTEASYRAIAERVASNVRRIVAGARPDNCVNWPLLGAQ